ncbi:MAG: hypothetical protein RLZZ28_1566, partial [Bacteroidota bacterium]
FYTLKIKSATNFFNVQHIYLISNVRYLEQKQLENTIPKN